MKNEEHELILSTNDIEEILNSLITTQFDRCASEKEEQEVINKIEKQVKI